MIEYKYAYLIGSLITLLIWATFFIRRKDLRKEMLTLSIITSFLAPTNILYFGSYWKPEFVLDIYNFGVESIIVCFAYGGICGVIYEFLYNRTPKLKRGIDAGVSKIQVLLSFALGIVTVVGLESLTDLNVIYTTSTGLLVMGGILIYFRSDLLFPGLIAATASTILSVIVYCLLLIIFPDFFNRFWIDNTITNIRLLFIPIEEYYFHFALGLALGILYEVQFGFYNKKLARRMND